MKPQILVLDTVDDRRELWYLIDQLAPRQRVSFLKWACRQAPQGQGRLPVPCVEVMQTRIEDAYRCDRASDRLTNEIYADILQLFNAFGVDALLVATEAQRWVTRPEYRREAIAGLATALPAVHGQSAASRHAAPSRKSCTGT